MRYSYVTIARYIARVAINLTLKCKLQLVRTVCQSTRQRMNRMQQTLSDLAAGTRLEHAVATETEHEIAHEVEHEIAPLFIGTSRGASQ